MPERELRYDVTFADFQFLQGYMTRRVVARNRGPHIRALIGIVLCATFLALAIVLNVNPYHALAFSSPAMPYPLSFYLLLIVLLIGAILTLIPAVKLRLKTMRMQVSDNGPLLGPTRLSVEPDGLVVDRDRMSARYSWSAFQGVEIAKTAVILPIDNGIGVIIPASAFASDAERFEFAAAIAKRIEAPKSGRREDKVVA
jgi:YcxB-like protein